jgi:hypothetical protein
MINEKIRLFMQYTVQDTNYRSYKQTWCGRYSILFGLLNTLYLNNYGDNRVPDMVFLRYSTSVDHQLIPVGDLGMGVTAPANIPHWIGYVSVGIKQGVDE